MRRDEPTWICDQSAEERARWNAASQVKPPGVTHEDELPPVEGARIVDALHRRFYEMFAGVE